MLRLRLLHRGCKGKCIALWLFVLLVAIVWLTRAITGRSDRLLEQSQLEESLKLPSVRSHQQRKKVYTKTFLAWTKKSGRDKWIPNNLRSLSCPVNTCKVTEDRSQLGTSDVIIFHSKDVDLQDLPRKRRKGQIWVYLNHEPPTQTTYEVVKHLSNKINISVTYRTDSDIFAPIYELMPIKNPLENSVRHNSSRKMVTWLVSHCKTSSNREGYVKKLKEFIPVDVWGSCGQKFTKCPKLGREECYKKLANDYKFYLAFENSLCKDYASEKLFLAMYAGMVPVVFGAANYSKILPPNSFIDALTFESPQALAEYLIEVDSNDKLLKSYSQWRTQFTVVQRRYLWLCELCAMLNSDLKLNSIKRNLTKWWFEEAHCRKWFEKDQ